MSVQELIDVIIKISCLIGAVTAICVFLKKVINKGLEPIMAKIDKIDKSQSMNYLVSFLADKEKGVEKDQVETQRAYDVYDHYVNDLKGNSYIKDKWERLMKGGVNYANSGNK